MALDILIDWQPYKTKFRGHEVTMELRPLKRGGMLALAPYMGKKGDETSLFIDALKLQELAKSILPDHCRGLDGITVNGETPTSDQLADEAVLNSLAVDVVGELAKITTLLENDEKNLERPSDGQT